MSLEERQKKEEALWKEWKAGNAQALPDLFKSFRPVETAWFNKIPTQNLPESAVRGEIKRIMYDSFTRFNPGRGVKLSTYVNSRMNKLYRYVNERQNIGRIPEHRALKITSFKAAQGELEQRLHREPNAAELADELGWDLKEIERLTKELRKDIILTEDFRDFSFHAQNQKQHVLNMVYYELDPREKKVFELVTGFGGKRIKSTKEIAKKLGVSAPTVGNIKKRIAKKVERYM